MPPISFDFEHGLGLLKETILDCKQRVDADIESWMDRLSEVAEIKELNIQLNTETTELAWEVVQHKPGGDERPLDSKLVSREEGQTSGEDNGSVERRITSWQKGKLLGNGSYGRVYEVLTDDGCFFAVKEVSLLHQGSQSLLYLEQEISLLSQLRHDNIVRYYGTEKDDEKIYLVLELMTKGSLAMLYGRYHLSDSQVSAYTRQMLNGLQYLHDQNVIHRDIKCANVLVDASGFVKLADFGLAKAIEMNDAKSCKGSAFWMAPEVVNLKNTGYGLAADIWSVGCTVLEMFTGRCPYYPLEIMQALFRIGKGELPPIPDSLSTDAQDFILTCLEVNPNNRPSAAQLLDHPFVRKPPTSSGFASPHSDNISP
ncbi:hypothetical protein ACJRO7_014366 [Eucalyptus globulus]|uniref:mitogen-activated protein kinase kinase kinase n=1 Tax=Eucalyptus globulus TaxID=34317 RepID=A0ABD3L0V8_EUCGL